MDSDVGWFCGSTSLGLGAVILFADLGIRHPEWRPRLENWARWCLPVCTFVAAAMLPGVLAGWLPWIEAFGTLGELILGGLLGGLVFLAHPQRAIFQRWHSPARGLALAYYQNHLRRIAVNLKAGSDLEAVTDGAGNGRKTRLHTGRTIELSVAMPSRLEDASFQMIGALKGRRRIVEYCVRGAEGGGSRPDAVYAVTPVDETNGDVRIFSMPTILTVVPAYLDTIVEDVGSTGDAAERLRRRLQEEQVKQFKAEVRSMMKEHLGQGVRFSFLSFEQLGLD